MSTHCHEMKKGQIYACKDCGLELKVITECKECLTPQGDCGCTAPCVFECCGQPLTLKK